MDLTNDVVFAAIFSILNMFVVWALEKLPVTFTTTQRPIVAQVLGAVAGLVYYQAPVYEYLNQAPVPDGATPGLFLVGGIMAGLASVGAHQTLKSIGRAFPRSS